jgi:hypothetical protein
VISVGSCVLVAALTGAAAVLGVTHSPAWSRGHAVQALDRSVQRRSPAPTTTTAPPPTTTTTTTLPLPGPGFVAGRVTAIGDSVMLDYEDPLRFDVPGVLVTASVGRQWGEGEAIAQYLRSENALGAEVIVALGSNGPITDADFDAMMSGLSGASRVVFVNVHVDRSWQDPNNAVIARGVTRYPKAVVADWAALAARNPQWFAGDGTHVGIDGSGAAALAALVTRALRSG